MSRSAGLHKQLGMPHGTAFGRLRKMVLFDLLKRHCENVCFRCKQVIETTADLTLEHKLPWEGRDASLFWDLSNIAFSHAACNKPHAVNRKGGAHRRVVAPDGEAWCSHCEQFLPEEDFSENASRWNGLQPYCDDCRSDRKVLSTRGSTGKAVAS